MEFILNKIFLKSDRNQLSKTHLQDDRDNGFPLKIYMSIVQNSLDESIFFGENFRDFILVCNSYLIECL